MPALQNDDTAWNRDKNRALAVVKSCLNAVKNSSVPINSLKNVVNIIKNIRFLIRGHDSNSSICPAINCVAMPKLINNDSRNRDIVTNPRPPIWMRIKIIICPNRVKLLNGIVKAPVTQVADVAVKKRSIRGIVCA